jgi:acid stress-induced BolA-like protein IbaG/YrbA
VDLVTKIASILKPALALERIYLDVEDDAITGYVVSKRFQGMSSLDRQKLLVKELKSAPAPLTPEELRQILMIAALTPIEFDSVGAKIKIQRITESDDGDLVIVLKGNHQDGEFIQELLEKDANLVSAEIQDVPDAPFLTKVVAHGTKDAPLTQKRAVALLASDFVSLMHDSASSAAH